MKIALVRILLLGYALMIVKPALPLLADRLAHKCWKSSHFRLVHFHNGKAHVDEEIGKASEDGQKQNSTTKIKCEVYDVYCVIHTENYTISGALPEKPEYNISLLYYPLTYPGAYYRPPRC